MSFGFMCANIFLDFDFRPERLVVEHGAVHAPDNVVQRHIDHVGSASMLAYCPCDSTRIHYRWEGDELS